MGKRSPILGYNHNIRYRGLVFHVQTEDSGVDNPHVFTHVFYGGVIVSTRKLTYDGDSAEDVVKSLMQAQHKALLKELKHGKLDDKIDQYFGDNPDLEPASPPVATPPAGVPKLQEEPSYSQKHKSVTDAFEAISDIGAVPEAAAAQTTDVYTKPPDTQRIANAPTMLQRDPPPAPTPKPTPAPAPAKPPPTPAPRRPVVTRSGSHRVPRSTTHRSSGVVVSRPAVIVSAPPKVVGRESTRRSRPRRAHEKKAQKGLFGQGLISEKSLDEVILAYLSDDAGDD